MTALVQSGGAVGTTSATATLSPGATAGNTIVAIATWLFTDTLTPSHTMPASMTLTAGPFTATTTNTRQIAVYIGQAAGGETNFTAGYSGGGSGVVEVEVMEFSGLGAAPAFDGTPTASSEVSSTSLPSMSVTPSNTADIVIVGGTMSGTISAESWSNGFTSVNHSTTHMMAGYKLPASTSAQSTVGSWTTTRGALGVIFALKPALPFTITKTLTGVWGVAGPVAKTLTGLWKVNGPLGDNFDVVVEVAWDTPPRTRPGEDPSWVGGSDWTRIDADVMADDVDVSPRLRTLDTSRGVRMLTGDMQAGGFTAKWLDQYGSLDKNNPDGPWADNIAKRRRARVWLVPADDAGVLQTDAAVLLSTAFIEKLTPSWEVGAHWVTMECVDLAGLMGPDTLPISVVDAVIRGLEPDAYFPLGEQSGATRAEDVFSTGAAVYNLPLQASGVLTNFDPRQGVTCGRPTGAQVVSQNVVRFPYSTPDEITLVGWFRKIPGDDATTTPAVITVQDGGGVPFTFTGSAGHNAIFVNIQHTLGEVGTDAINLTVRTPSGYNTSRGPKSHDFMDGEPHMLAMAIDGSTKTMTTWVDGVNQGTRTEGGSPSVALSTLNVSSLLSNVNMWAAGWGIAWDSASTVDNSANVGLLPIFHRILTDTEVAAIWDAGINAWNADTTGDRATNVLTLDDVDPGDLNIADGTQVCSGTTLNNQGVIPYIGKVVDTEHSAFFTNADGKLTFLDRTPDTPTLTFTLAGTTAGGATPYKDITPVDGVERLVGRVIVKREGGQDRIRENPTAIADYDAPEITLDTLLAGSDTADALGDYILDRNSTPRTVVTDVKLELRNRSVPASIVTDREIGDAGTVKFQPSSFGPETSQTSVIERVEHHFDWGTWDWWTVLGVTEHIDPS